MSIVFTDNFDRANGPLGSPWSKTSPGNWSVYQLHADKADYGSYTALMPYSGADQAVQIANANADLRSDDLAVAARSDGTDLNYYLCHYAAQTSGTLRITKVVNGVGTNLATAHVDINLSLIRTLRLECEGTHLRAYVDGVLCLDIVDSTWATGTHVGMGGTYGRARMDNFQLESIAPAPPATMIVWPTIAQLGQIGLTVYLTGENTNWTPGTPGVPEFTVDVGAITSQTVNTPTSATLTVNTPLSGTSMTFTDPDSDAQATMALTMTQADALAALLIATCAERPGATVNDVVDAILATTFPVDQGSYPAGLYGTLAGLGPYSDFGAYLAAIWDAISTYPPSSSNAYTLIIAAIAKIASVGNIAADIDERVQAIATGIPLSLLDVIDGIKGSGGGTVNDVLVAIDALRNGASPSVVTIVDQLLSLTVGGTLTLQNMQLEIAAVRGYGFPDLATIMQEWQDWRTFSHYTAQDILNAIGEIPPFDPGAILAAIATLSGNALTYEQAILAAIDLIPTNPITSLQPALDAIAAVRGSGNPDLAALLAAILAIPTNPITDLSPVLDAVSDVSNQITDLSNALLLPPIWPGLDGVTLGSTTHLAATGTVTAPMHGALIHITDRPPEVGRWTAGGFFSYYHTGHYFFVTDNGYAEDFRMLGMDRHLVTPMRTRQAASIVLHLRAGMQADVTPWVLNP